MEKISGILPAKPRITSEKEPLPPVRAGAPSFGRPESSTAAQDRVTLSSIKNTGIKDLSNYKNPREAKNVKIVDDLNRKFFQNTPINNIDKVDPVQKDSVNDDRIEFPPPTVSMTKPESSRETIL